MAGELAGVNAGVDLTHWRRLGIDPPRQHDQTFGCSAEVTSFAGRAVTGKSSSFLGPAQTRKGYRFRGKSSLLAVGWFVVRRPLGVPIKFTLTCPLLLTATLAVYDLLIRRIGVLRLLSGMKPTADTSRPTAG
ncbi:MAG: hypothetical protein ACM3ZO_05040 [Clostridia bacterium]